MSYTLTSYTIIDSDRTLRVEDFVRFLTDISLPNSFLTVLPLGVMDSKIPSSTRNFEPRIYVISLANILFQGQ